MPKDPEPQNPPRWVVYMIECAGGRIYTGITTDVERRYRQHCAGRGAAYTRRNKPVRILAAKSFETRGDALRQEYALKQLKRPAKWDWANAAPWIPDR